MFNELAEEIHEWAEGNGFWEDGPDRNPAAILMLIVSEVAEALEEIRDGKPLNHMYYGERMKPEGVPSEMADIIIRVLDACAAWGIDIDEAIEDKMRYNRTRPYKHNRTM